jgi:hypothetical protein
MPSPSEAADTPCAADTDPNQRRCACGKLLARATRGGLELKCSRCRRLVLIPWAEVRGEDDPP